MPIHCIYRKTWKKSPYTHQYRDIYQCNKNLDEIWSQLDKRMFASIRVACIVNLSEIVQVVRDELLLKNGNTLHVGRAYRQEIKLRHLQFLKEQL